MRLKIKKLNPKAVVPSYATDGAACFDLHAADVDGFSGAMESHVFGAAPIVCGTGLAFEIPEGHVMLIFSRSGHGFKHSTRLANCVGVIDADYRGEVKVKLTRDTEAAPFLRVSPGDRIAQAMVLPVERVSFELVDELGETERGVGGFGSTGQ